MTPQEIVHELDKHQGNLLRSAVELAKDWRTDRMLRRLEAMLAVADPESSLMITGTGDVLEPADIVRRSLEIAGELCIYTNQNHVVETL